MLKTAKEIYAFLNEKIDEEAKKLLPLPQDQEAVSLYVERLAAIDALKPFIILQSEVKEVFPLDSSGIQYVKDLFTFLNAKPVLKGKLPDPKPNESYAEYSQRLQGIDELNNYPPLATLIPQSSYRRDTTSWKNRKSGLENFAQKMGSSKMLLIQDRHGNIHERSLERQFKGSAAAIYAKTKDWSLAQLLGEMIDQQLVNFPEDVHGPVIKVIMDNLPFLNSDVTMFYEGIMTAELELTLDFDILQKLKAAAKSLANQFNKVGMQSMQVLDDALLKTHLQDYNPDLGIEFKYAQDLKVEKGVLITTSNGGGCHKTIANTVAKTLNDQGVNAAIINESVLTQVDPMQQFFGIPHCDFYPVVFQQCGQMDCRDFLRKIDDQINSHFIPPYEFAQLRAATNYCNNQFTVGTVFSTQHYSTDLRIVPPGAQLIFQVCDYGHCGKLDDLVIASAKLFEKTHSDYGVRFLVPSTTCLQAINGLSESSNKLFVTSIAPTKILSSTDTAYHFKNLIQKEGLFAEGENDVFRCAIVMGGQGCGHLIEEYIDKIAKEIEENQVNQDEKFEIMVVCGNNAQLQKDLMSKYTDMLNKLPANIKIKFCGRVENAELIAYNKNGILLTKPGGGTIAECIENHIQTLVHYDAALPWERGNAEEIPKQELGKIVSGTRDLDKPAIQIKDVNLLTEIREATKARDERMQAREDLESVFNQEIDALTASLIVAKNLEANEIGNNLMSLDSFSFYLDGDYDELISHIEFAIKSLSKLKEKYPTSTDALLEMNELKNIRRAYLTKGPRENVREHLASLDTFLEKHDKTSTEAFIAKQVLGRK